MTVEFKITLDVVVVVASDTESLIEEDKSSFDNNKEDSLSS